ncbi:HupE/UreJ family protein [Phyllobacterium sp. YR531]|uniref:HupE/UreJ family protein n=1 Tax=Phyllobacterium sp. YR531 TaxID=1144343 RepID=UPI00026F639A|nr:HupE/UreJ family protein [Phyllobacterium sp. YR531]EJN06237.1 hydrogenase/urease accessory protein [Phyllobacterium sp. YR531]
MKKTLFLSLPLVLIATSPAFAHLNPAEHGSFAAGFSHPMFGTDHILAMVAVGLWAVLLGGRALWLVPAAFVGTMMAGFFFAIAGAPLPFVEPTILASVVAIGLFAAVAIKVPTSIAMLLVGFFALFHGHAHGGEMGAATAISYLLGFAVATTLLHAVGLGLGTLLGAGRGRVMIRAAGAGTAFAGLWLAFGA